MMFLKKFLQLLKKWFRKNEVIPHDFDSNEIILRAVFRPLFFSLSKNKLKAQVFLPPSRQNDPEQRSRVSVFRKKYSNDSACKKHAMNIYMKDQSYAGFLSFLVDHLSIVNADATIAVKAKMIYTPIDENNKYRFVKGNIFYVSDPGAPMHAEIQYSKPVEVDNPNTDHRMFADALLELVEQSMHVDKHLGSTEWLQPEIVFIAKR